MPGSKPPAVPVSEPERQELQALVHAHTTAQQIALRARIILLLADGLTAPAVARQLKTTRRTVRLWRRHWLERPGSPVRQRLQDAPRPGAPATFTAEQWCQIMALACAPPDASSGRPLSHWTARELADEAIKRGMVDTLSVRHLGRFLKGGRAQAPPESLLAQHRPGRGGRREDDRCHHPLSPGPRVGGRGGAGAGL